MTQAHEGQSALKAAERLLEASRYRAACSAFASLAHTDAHSATAHVGWGRALKGLRNYDEAASRFEKAIAADPADDRAFDELGEIWEYLSKRDALLARIQHRLDAIKASGAHRAWAAFLSRIGLHQRGLAEYDRAARARKRDADFLLRWGKASADTGLHEQALERFIGAIPAVAAEGRQDRDCFDLVADSLRALGTPDHQVARIQTCVDAVDSHAIRLQWAQALLAIGRAAASAAQSEKVILAQPHNVGGWYTWGKALVASGAEVDAMSKFARAIELDASNRRGYAAVAGLMRKSKTAEADIARIQAIVDKAATAAAHNEWAVTLAYLDRPELAVAQFEAAHQISATQVSTSRWAAALEQLQRNPDAAMLRVRSFETAFPSERSRHRNGLLRMLRSNRLDDSDLEKLQHEVDRINSATTYAEWGGVLGELRKNVAALEQIERAATRRPDDNSIALGRASVLARLGQHADALDVLSRAFGRNEDQDARVLEQIELSLTQVSPDIKASVIASMQAMVERVGRVGASLRWGQVLLKVGERATAVAEFERAAELDPENATVQVELAKALTADGRFADAADCCARAVALGAGEPKSLSAALDTFKAAVVHLESDRYIDAVDGAIRTIDGANSYAVWADTLGEIDRPGAQIKHSQKQCEKAPTDSRFRAVYAHRLVQAGKSEDGLAEHERAAELEPGGESVHRLWGQLLAYLQRYRDAMEQYHRAAELGSTEHYFEWALALHAGGSSEAAVEKYREHMRIKEGDPVQLSYSLHNIACIREDKGNYTAAANEWDAALQAYERAAAQPGDAVDSSFYAYMSSALVNDVRRDFNAAEKCLAAAVRLNPSNAAVHGGLATLYLRRIEDLAPDGRDAEDAPVYHAKAREAYATARQILDRRLKDLPTALTFIELGQLHLAFDDYDSAKSCFTKALELDKDSAEAWSLLGKTFLRADELKSSLNCARAAVSREPHSLTYRTGLADVHRKLNELDKAESEYRKALAVAPNHVDALVGLAKTYLAMGSELQKSGRSSDAENMFARAPDQLSQATSVAGRKCGSKRLSRVESAALCYTRGYANVMRYESQTVAKRNQKLLEDAVAAFDDVPKGDANFHKAQRAKAKILEQTEVIDRSARWGAWIIVIGALLMLLVANVAFLVGKPGLTRTLRVTDQSVQLIKAAKAPEDVAARLETLSRRGGLPKAAFEAELRAALGEEWAKKLGDTVREQASGELSPGWQESIEAGYYALLSFGALMFVVAGLYLQQLSKLKFGGFELEKTSEATTKVIGSLGITP